MQFEPIKPTHAGLSPGNKLCHHFIRPNAAVVTYADLSRINEADSTALFKVASQKVAQGRQATLQ
ncbi:hypothetical protein SAMN05421863_101660 [Nitrosomonas communis]|uniref:Uncharacterized protein n=1 Tax=Nitrosomonas communis TaxID=44574 RepID=A0A1I4NUF0_9PROT|nr:hypothetical protein [Nitrosomonas communis]SFM19142.1 hypothetical protein SAMN05421863_101660 [Nitrosomonas communis]